MIMATDQTVTVSIDATLIKMIKRLNEEMKMLKEENKELKKQIKLLTEALKIKEYVRL
jgi:cell division protein FtsB